VTGARGPVVHTCLLVAGAAVGATVLGLLHLPAGVLIGSVVGSARVNRSRLSGGRPRPAQRAVRVAGLVLLGCAVATQVTGRR
jgi:uncharacterized membrane protein AbrB (regulator of aidB expression)